MISYQKLKELQILYRKRALGISYCDELSEHYASHPNNLSEQETLPETIEALHGSVSQCHLCDLSKSRKCALGGYGKADADLMIISDVPSIAENNEGILHGRAARKLAEMLASIGLNFEKVYYTHMVKCIPLPGEMPNSREQLSCKPYVQRQIELVQPRLIVTLGQISYNYLTSDTTPYHTIAGEMQNYHGYTHISIHSPGFLLRNPSYENETMSHLKKIERFLCGA